MSITDELREYAHDCCARVDDAIHAIADRIDAEHERAMADAYLSGTPTDEKLTELGWVRLPRDADDVPWNVGDRDEDGNVVTEIRLTSDGWFVITDGEWPYRPESKRHYHAQTVEDVLREFANEVYADADNEIRDRDFLCAKYAKRLTLAEGEDA